MSCRHEIRYRIRGLKLTPKNAGMYRLPRSDPNLMHVSNQRENKDPQRPAPNRQSQTNHPYPGTYMQ